MYSRARKTEFVLHTAGSLREVVKRMCEAEYLVFDLTDERPNLYFELGYAFGIGNHAENVLLIAKTGSRIHFDVARFVCTSSTRLTTFEPCSRTDWAARQRLSSI